MGTHDELLSKKGVYYRSVRSKEKATKVENNDKPFEERFEQSDDDELGILEVEKKNEPTMLTENEKAPKEISKFKHLIFKLNPCRIFKYEAKLLRMQRNELLWLIIGTISQIINGIVYPLIAMLFCEIDVIFGTPDPDEQVRLSLQYMYIIFGLSVVNGASILEHNYAFGEAGARLTKRLRVKVFECLLRQEIGFHDLDENKSSVLTTKLATSAPLCKGMSSDKLSLLSQGFAGVGFSLITAFILNWKLSLVMSVFIPVSFLAFWRALLLASSPQALVKSKETRERRKAVASPSKQ
jgi:ABC-type multidrug transport system fused ATPase/permease subunit